MNVKKELSKNQNITSNVLYKLSMESDLFILENIAKNPNTPAELLRQLANNKAQTIKNAVASNPNKPNDLFSKKNVYDNPKFWEEYILPSENIKIHSISREKIELGLKVKRYPKKEVFHEREIDKVVIKDKNTIIVYAHWSNSHTMKNVKIDGVRYYKHTTDLNIPFVTTFIFVESVLYKTVTEINFGDRMKNITGTLHEIYCTITGNKNIYKTPEKISSNKVIYDFKNYNRYIEKKGTSIIITDVIK